MVFIATVLLCAWACADDNSLPTSKKTQRSETSESKHRAVTIAGEPGIATFQFNIQRTGYFRGGESLPKEPKVIWKFVPRPVVEAPGQLLASLGGIAPGTPVVDKGVVYFGDDGGRLWALDSSTGQVKWVYKHGPHGISQAPCVADGKVYFSSRDGVECVFCENSRLVWSRDLPRGAAECSPLMVGAAVLVASPDGIVYAFDKETGDTIWRASLMIDVQPDPKEFDSKRARFEANAARPVSSASDGKTVFQSIFDQSRVVALDCKTGRQIWSFHAGGWIYDQPVVTQQFVFVGSQDRHLHCLDRSTGKPHWKFPVHSRIEAGAAVAQGRVYFGACDGRVYCADVDSGKQIWTYKTEPDSKGTRAIYCAPLVTDRIVYVAAMDGQLYALDAVSGEERWVLRVSHDSEINGSSLATDGRRLFVTTRQTPKNRGEYGVFAIGED
jgi:outer membrane protein assembly factor BamB